MDGEIDYDQRRAEALQKLAEGEPEDAFHHFRWALWYRPGPVDAAIVADALGVLARICVAMGMREVAEACARASTSGTAETYYEAGYELIEARAPAIAATVLARALELAPGSEPIVTELVAALERALLYRSARDILAGQPALVASSFPCRYLYAYDSAMCGDLATARALAPGLAPRDETQAFMAARIAQLLARADRVAAVAPLDDHDLRGWHYVITGGVLLHRSPYGFDEPMRGRFAWLQDSADRIRTGIDRLCAALGAWGVALPCVYAPPGHEHDIVAEVVATRLGVPRAPWPAVGVPAPGLVVAYDLDRVEWKDLEGLVDRRPDQILYAHAASWTEDGPVAPDLVTLLHQHLVAPSLTVAEIAGAPPIEVDPTDDLAGLDALVAAVGAPAPARRERLWAGSPVLSNRFV